MSAPLAGSVSGPAPGDAREPSSVLAGDLRRLRARRASDMDLRLEQVMTAALDRHRQARGRVALVAVGGYGRGELSPYSDIDVVLVHEPSLGGDLVAALADALWYPLWDDGVPLDHAVRDTVSMREMAARDLRAATGMLDARHVAGEADLSMALRSTVLADWRREARSRLPALRQACAVRAERAGDLAYAAVPDLKESRGGLRDGGVLRALVATWLVDVPRHRAGESHRSALLDVRDTVHEVSGRRGDRLHPELVPDVAARLGRSPDELSLHVRDLGRRTAHLVQLTWRRVDQVLGAPTQPGPRTIRRPPLVRLGDGVATVDGEVVLAPDAHLQEDPWLGLRAATLAATNGLVLSPTTAQRLASAQAGSTLPDPWPEHASRQLVRLLAAGPGLVPVWEELDQCGLIDGWLPEWQGIRLRASRSAVHRFTVDRHLVETCVEATRLLPEVARPDLLVVAALLHDIGKHGGKHAEGEDHSAVGAPMAERIALRWGFPAADARLVALLVRQHLLLPETAVRRDIDDPVTLGRVADLVVDDATLELLAALTEADARAATPAAWTSWRAGLVRRLVTALHATLSGGRPLSAAGKPLDDPADPEVPEWAGRLLAGEVRLLVDPARDGTQVRVAAADRVGLLADVGGALATAGLTVRSARAAVYAGTAVSTWDVESAEVDQARLRLRLDRVLDGSVDLRQRLGSVHPAAGGLRVRVLPDVSGRATVLEVRASDRTGLVWRLCRALADAGIDVRSAHLDTLGPQAEDVVYVTDTNGLPLDTARAEHVRAAVEAALTGRSTAGDG